MLTWTPEQDKAFNRVMEIRRSLAAGLREQVSPHVEDDPEGTVVIQISATLVRQWIDRFDDLRTALADPGRVDCSGLGKMPDHA